MKPLTLILALVIIGSAGFTQSEKMTIYCRLKQNGKADYGDLVSILTQIMPDSVKEKLLIDPRKQFHLKKTNALLLMTLNGWKLIQSDTYVTTDYLLTKDIYLSEKDKDLFLLRLKTLSN